MNQVLLQTSNVAIGYSNQTIMKNLNMKLNVGELVCLLGANGVGKSTLLRTLAGTQKPLEGSILIDGKDITKTSRKDMARMMGLVYTDRTLAGGLTVRELVSLGRQPHTGFLGRLSQSDYEVVDEALSMAGVLHKADNFVAELSDGERQKAMIAKALAQQTPIILLDEPTAFLDVASKIETMRLLHNLAHNSNKSILLSTHDVSQALTLADRLWIADNDSYITEGFTEDLILKGTLDTLFPTAEVTFDTMQGDFKANSTLSRFVSLNSTSEPLLRWAQNALKRNKIGVSDKSDISVNLIASDNIEINAKMKASSFEEMIAILNSSQLNY